MALFRPRLLFGTRRGRIPQQRNRIAAADLNQDGKQDVVLTWNGGFWVYLGNGDGTFNTPLNYSTPCGAYGCYGSSVALADINGDNKLDVIMSDAFRVNRLGLSGQRRRHISTGDRLCD